MVNGAHDLYVQALAGGEQLAVAIGMTVDIGAAPKSFSAVGSASITLAQTDDNDETKNKTEAVVEDSTITGEAGSDRNMEVTAYNRTYIGTGGGSLTVSAGASTAKGAMVGGAVSWADVRNDAKAGIYGSSISQLDTLDVRAYNATEIGSGAAMLTVAPTAAGVDSFAGSQVVNQIVNNTTAEIDRGSSVNVSGSVNVLAADRGADNALEAIIDPDGERDNTAKGLDYCGESAGGAAPSGNCIVAVAGTVQAGRGANYGVSIAYNEIENNLTARINQSSVTAAAIDVKAQSDTSILGLGLGVGVSTDKFSGAGSISIADISNKVHATVTGSATTLTAPLINVAASDESSIQTLAGQVNVAFKNSAVGAAATYNNIGNEVKAQVDGAVLNVSGALDVHAREDAEIMSLAAAGGYAKDTNASVSLAVSFIDNAVESAIKNSTVRDGAAGQNTVQVRAEDNATIKSLAGSVGVGQQAGGGAAFALNRIGGSVSAQVQNSTIDSANVLKVLADSAHVLWSMAAAVGGGRDGYAGSVAINDIGETSYYGDGANTVLAEISDSTVINGNGADITVHAKDDSDIRSVTGGAAIGINSTAIGGAVGENRIHTDVIARVNNASLQHSDKIVLEGINDSSIKALSASGAFSSGDAFSGSESANKIGNSTKAELKDSEITGAVADVVVSARDTATIDALAGGAAFSGSGSIGLAIAANRIESTTTANVSGKKNAGYSVNNMQVLADSLATIQALSVSLAGSGGSAGAGNIAINLLGSDTKAFIDKGAVLVAQDNVGVLAQSDDRITIASGAAGIGFGGAGVGASLTINNIDGETAAYIGDKPEDYSGAATSVTALAKNSANALSVNDGTLTSAVELAKQVDLAQYNKLVLADSRNKVSVTGIAVNASSTEQIENIGTNVAGGSGAAIGVIESTSLIGGSTQAYILNANINSDNTGAGASQQVSVSANNIAYDNSFVGNVAVSGGGSAGVGADVHGLARTTQAYTAGGSIKARDAVSVNARSLQGISSVTVGAAQSHGDYYRRQAQLRTG